jgi:hypothetical protein
LSVFRVFNIADPAAPYLVGSVGSAGYSYAVAATGDYAFLPTWQDGLVVINTADPSAPFIETKHPGYGWSGYAELEGDLLFLEDVLILNVFDPLIPYEVGELQVYGNTADAAIADTLIYLASGDSELMTGWMRIVSIADPANPYSVGSYSISNEAQGVSVDGNRACVTDGVGIYVLDVSDPANPLLLTTGGVLGMWALEMDSEYIYVSGSGGFFIFQLSTLCGDANDDGEVNVADAVYIIRYIFAGGPPPPWICKADASGDGRVDVGDAVYLINYIFRSGPPPVESCCSS